jgi:hypothetical protein
MTVPTQAAVITMTFIIKSPPLCKTRSTLVLPLANQTRRILRRYLAAGRPQSDLSQLLLRAIAAIAQVEPPPLLSAPKRIVISSSPRMCRRSPGPLFL